MGEDVLCEGEIENQTNEQKRSPPEGRPLSQMICADYLMVIGVVML